MKTLQTLFRCVFPPAVIILFLAYMLPNQVFASGGKTQALITPPIMTNIRAIDLGWEHTCALTTSGAVKCWGANWSGQLGDGTITHRQTPTNVRGLASGISAISAGYRHTCALTTGGGVKCWGMNAEGQLGDGTNTERHAPVNVSGLTSGIAAISAGYKHTCALTTEGGVKCWGGNWSGQLGDTTTIDQNIPTDVSGLTSGVVAISAGGYHTCALTTGGGIKCWGENVYGQLGDGTTSNQTVPTDVKGLTSGIVSISAGGNHTCAVTTGGTAKCWGFNRKGQLGNGQNANSSRQVNVLGLTRGVSTIESGDWHTCALTTNNGVKCWGWNISGQLGDGTHTDHNTYVNVTGMSSGVASISSGHRHTCALTSGGGVKCWGYNFYGQLGDGTTITNTTPVNVIFLNKAIFRSTPERDGYVLESSENSSVGNIVNSNNYVLYVGDDDSDRQYRIILSFNTSALPDNAVIFSAMIQLYWTGSVGGDPYWSPMVVDIRKPFFGTSVWLLPEDFQAPPSRALVGTFPSNGNTSGVKLSSAAFPHINLMGNTQFRIRTMQDDNDDMSADYNIFVSSDEETANRPQLIIQYYVP